MLVERVRAEVREGGLLAGAEPVLAMISAGRDSTCLLDVAVALRGPGAVSALHVNYGLRAESAEEQERCVELCALLGVELEIVDGGGAPRGARRGTSRPGRASFATRPRVAAPNASAR